MENISGQGLRVTLRASRTFPVGISLSQFADDADSLDTPSVQIADKAMGLNGDLVIWGTNSPLLLTLNVIPNTDDDSNLGLLFEANRVSKGKVPAQDTITIIVQYPNGKTKTFARGACTDFVPTTGVASAGRLKTRPFSFAFENMVET